MGTSLRLVQLELTLAPREALVLEGGFLVIPEKACITHERKLYAKPNDRGFRGAGRPRRKLAATLHLALAPHPRQSCS